MENISRSVDPAADLELLDRARKNAVVDDVLDFGAWWYAPMIATMVGGLTLYGRGGDDRWSLAYGLAAVVATIVTVVHDYRRRKVRSRTTVTSIVYVVAVVLLLLLVTGLWGTAVSSVGYDDFVPGYAIVGWLLTTGFFLAVRAALTSFRRRRGPLV